MDDAVAVHVFECRDNLKHEIACLFDSQFFPFLDHFAQCFVRAELEYDIYVFSVLKYAIELNNVFMVQCLVDFDFGQ